MTERVRSWHVRDTDLYDLKIRDRGRTAVIDTMLNHLFWVPGTGGHGGRWIKAKALKYGSHPRTPSVRDTATVFGGWTPLVSSGWMWDLSIPGDHDFYIDTVAAPVLVHNCDIDNPASFSGASRAEAEQELEANGWQNEEPTSKPGGVRWRLPGNQADQIRIMPGNSADPDPIKQGPYIRFSIRGRIYGPYPLSDFLRIIGT